MLPQLPKKFTIKEKPTEEAGIPENIVKKAKHKEKKALAALKKKKILALKHQKDEANKMKAAEIKRRAALELIRKNLKKDKQAKAEADDPLARLREELKRRNNTKSTGSYASPSSKRQAQKYGGLLYKVIRRNYELPQASNFANAKMLVTVRIMVGEVGNLMKIGVEKSSGDTVFDEMALKAVRASVPFPKPPRGQVAETIFLNFSPQSF